MKSKVYKILKRYPSLNECFQVGDFIYYAPIEGEYEKGFIPSIAYVYKKILHQQKDPFIWQDEVENNPEFFEYLPNGVRVYDDETVFPLTPEDCYLPPYKQADLRASMESWANKLVGNTKTD